MSQQESSKTNKKVKNKTYAKPGSLSFIENNKRQLLTTNEIVQVRESQKRQLLNVIGQPLVAQQYEATGQYVEKQPLEHPIELQPVDDQLHMNSGTPTTGEQPEEQGNI